MAKFTASPTPSFEPDQAAPPDPTAMDALTGFVENDALYLILVAVIVIFLGFQIGRWALNRDWEAKDDENEVDLRQR